MENGVGMETPNSLMAVFSNTVSAGFAALQGPVDGVFGLMIALVVALTGVQWALSPNRELLAAGFGKVLLIGAFAWLINDWQSLSETLQSGFIALGLAAGGGALTPAEFLNPGAILQQGWEIVQALGETSAPVNSPLDVAGNLTDALILGLAMIGIMLAFAVLALQIIVTLLEFKIVTLGGFVLLPFGIWSKSAFMAERPLGYVVAAGLKVLALAIVVSGARSVFDQLQPTANPDLYEALAILSAALLLAMLALFIPSLAAALVTGGPSLGAGAAAAGGLAVLGGGALALAGAAGLGAALGGAGARTAGTFRAAAGAGASRAGPPFGGGQRPPVPDPGRGFGPRPNPPPPAPPGSALPRPATAMAEAAADGAGEATAPAAPSQAPSPGPAPDARPWTARRNARETAEAGAAFHRALGPASPAADSGAGRRRTAAQSFFLANAGRSLLPGSETSGAVSPDLKREDP